MEDAMSIGFTKAMNDYFGRKPEQSVGDFGAELKALDQADREYFVREFKKIGVDVDMPEPIVRA
jgi:hypothetical protein